MWVSEQIVQNVGVQDRLAGKFLAELVAADDPFLLELRQVELDLRRGVPLERTTLLVLLYFQARGSEGSRVAVDDVFQYLDFGDAKADTADVGEDSAR